MWKSLKKWLNKCEIKEKELKIGCKYKWKRDIRKNRVKAEEL